MHFYFVLKEGFTAFVAVYPCKRAVYCRQAQWLAVKCNKIRIIHFVVVGVSGMFMLQPLCLRKR